MGRKKIATTVYIDPEQLESLTHVSKRTGISKAELIRIGIDLRLAQARTAAPRPKDRSTVPLREPPEVVQVHQRATDRLICDFCGAFPAESMVRIRTGPRALQQRTLYVCHPCHEMIPQ